MHFAYGLETTAVIWIIMLSLFASTASEMIHLPGNVTVVGLFEIHEPENAGCGTEVSITSIMSAEAIKWYFQNLNEANAFPIKIGFDGHRTCRSESMASQVAVETLCRSLASKNETNHDIIAGIIGPTYSQEAEAISPILSSVERDDRVLQVGYSTTAKSLADVVKYPNIIRVIPHDDIQIDVMVKTMLKLEWKRIAIIYENDVYGREGALQLKANAEIKDICVAYTAAIDISSGIDTAQIKEIIANMTIGTKSVNSINGFVYFSTVTSANVLFRVLNNNVISSPPVCLLSEGIQLQKSVLEANNLPLNKAKGLYVVAPTFRDITEFGDHWKTIFTDKSKFEEESKTNPWLYDVYRSVAGCSDACQFEVLSEDDVETHFGSQPLYIQYAIKAAHAVAKGLQFLHTRHCGTTSELCSDFYTKFSSGQMIDVLKTSSLNFAEDFSWKLQSLATDLVTLDISSSGEVTSSAETPPYQLFNFRQTEDDKTKFDFVKVGEFLDEKMVLNTGDIRDYDNTGSVLVWPNIRKAVCNKGKLCGGCIPTDLPERFIFEPGDVYVVGLVPVYDKSKTNLQGCTKDIRVINSYQIAEGIRFGVKRFKDDPIYSTYFKHVKVGLIILNTCNNPTVSQRKVLNLHAHGLRLDNGTTLDLTNKIIGYVGPLGSTVSISLSRTLQKLNKVQISYASTSPALSEREEHPYFMRVVTPDSHQVNVMIDMIKKLEGDYIQLVYSKGAYGEGGRDKVHDVALENNICVVQSIEVEEASNYYQYYERLRKYPHAKLVIIFLRSHVVMNFFASLVNTNIQRGEFVFIGSEAWANNILVLNADAEKQVTLGSYTLYLEMVQSDSLSTHIRNIEPTPYRVNPWVRQYLQKQLNCFYPDSFDKTQHKRCENVVQFREDPDFRIDSWPTAAYNAMLSLLMGAGSFLNKHCGENATELCSEFTNNPGGLVTEIKEQAKLDLYGNGKKDKVFNSNGDGNVGYNIYNIQKDEDNPQKLTYTNVGQYPVEGSSIFNPPSGQPISRCPNEQACRRCKKDQTIIDNGNKPDDLNIGMLVLGVLFGASVLVVLVLVIVIYRLKNTRNIDKEIYLTPTPMSSDGFNPAGERPDAVGGHYNDNTALPASCEIIPEEESKHL